MPNCIIAGVNGGLSLVLNVEQDEYIETYSTIAPAGFQVIYSCT